MHGIKKRDAQVAVYINWFGYLKNNQTTKNKKKKMGRNRPLTKSKVHDPTDVRKKELEQYK